LKLPNVGDLVRLKKGTLPDLKVREWTFLGKTSRSVILINYKPKGRILKVVREDDIDWDDYRKRNAFAPFLQKFPAIQ
jgi:hypothetical protein